MSIFSHATTRRELDLIAAANARGNRQALMRAARHAKPHVCGVLVRSARDFNRDMLRYLARARALS
jgi:hypothetical protein